MSENAQPEILIINRRIGDADEDAHGGVWKIALADFMTALMAFFLIMWLVNATDEETKKAIATYFNPILLAESTTDRKGLQDPETSEGPDGPHEGEPGFEHRTRTAPDDPARAAAAQAAQRIAALERAAYQDPYAILAELSRLIDPRLPTRPDVQLNEPGVSGETAGDDVRDPFDPVYWQTVTTHPQVTLRPGEPGTVGREPEDLPVDAAAPSPTGEGRQAPGAVAAVSSSPTGGADALPASAAAADAGGMTAGAAAAMDGSEEDGEARLRRFREIAERLSQALAADGIANLEVVATPEGVLISLTDEADYSMFPIGSAVPRRRVLELMERIAGALGEVPGEVIVRGHTDGRPFRSETYDNWRLSTARAHMAQYMLVRGGLPPARVASVEGYADRRLKDPQDPYAAVNRRIEILLQPDAAAVEARP